MELVLSTLPKTWIFDLDGTLLEHNGYLHGGDRLLDGVKELFDQIPQEDYILILTARSDDCMEQTKIFLAQHGIRYNTILNNMPFGERILFNDNKPSGLVMGYAVNIERDKGIKMQIKIDENI